MLPTFARLFANQRRFHLGAKALSFYIDLYKLKQPVTETRMVRHIDAIDANYVLKRTAQEYVFILYTLISLQGLFLVLKISGEKWAKNIESAHWAHCYPLKLAVAIHFIQMSKYFVVSYSCAIFFAKAREKKNLLKKPKIEEK